jgi:hypothetical protein
VGQICRNDWSLEPVEVDALMDKLICVGIPLIDFLDSKPCYGIKTGLNKAFLINKEVKDKLINEDIKSAEIIQPYLRGQDIKRWAPECQDLWMLVLPSSTDKVWAWSNLEGSEAETYSLSSSHLYIGILSSSRKIYVNVLIRENTGGSCAPAATMKASKNLGLFIQILLGDHSLPLPQNLYSC